MQGVCFIRKAESSLASHIALIILAIFVAYGLKFVFIGWMSHL